MTFTPAQRVAAQAAGMARRDYEQREHEAERRRALDDLDKASVGKSRFIDLPRPMTPEQFAFWVKGIAENGALFQPLDLLNRILDTVRVMK